MLTTKNPERLYRALLDRNPAYEGMFYVGVKTTGVFCRPTCPARKPKFANCEFFASAEQALLASYRPCMRCRPLSAPNGASDTVRRLVEAVERNPEKRWTDADFAALAINASTARRQFRRRFGMTFVGYARARRMGLAMKQIREGAPVIEAQVASGYESGSGFRDAFSRIMGIAPAHARSGVALKAAWIDTRLGPMVAIADDDGLYVLEFVDRRGLEREVERLRKRVQRPVVPGQAAPLAQIERELSAYFARGLRRFETPVHFVGSEFQRGVWAALTAIPYGETRSYAELATVVGDPRACRAVARANGTNQLALVVPCHRVIQSDGRLGGYGGGLARKQWLIDHERRGGA